MRTNKKRLALIHASPAAIEPAAQFFGQVAPELEITCLLDEHLLTLLAEGRLGEAEDRLTHMLTAARTDQQADLALLTCSAVPLSLLDRLRGSAMLPVLKIDEDLGRRAVQAGTTIGLVVTFPPTLETTSKLLNNAAAEAGVTITIVSEVLAEARQALLIGDHLGHDALVLAGIRRLDQRQVHVIVLAQVSMTRVISQLDCQVNAPVLSSLHTSLDAIYKTLERLP